MTLKFLSHFWDGSLSFSSCYWGWSPIVGSSGSSASSSFVPRVTWWRRWWVTFSLVTRWWLITFFSFRLWSGWGCDWLFGWLLAFSACPAGSCSTHVWCVEEVVNVSWFWSWGFWWSVACNKSTWVSLSSWCIWGRFSAHLHRQISQSWGHSQWSFFTVRRVRGCPCSRRSFAASCRIDWLVVSECTTDSLA